MSAISKNKGLLIVLLGQMILFSACSSSSDDGSGIVANGVTSFLPTTEANSWTYENTNDGNPDEEPTEETYIMGTPDANNKYPIAPQGEDSFLGILENVAVRNENASLFLSGSLSGADGFETGSLVLDDFKILEEAVTNERVLDNKIQIDTLRNDPETNEELEYPVIITTYLQSIQRGGRLDVTLRNNTIYTQTIKTDILIDVQADVLVDGPVDTPYGQITLNNQRFEIMSKQNIGLIQLHFANEVGLVQSDTYISTENVELADNIMFLNVTVPISEQTDPLEQYLQESPPTDYYSQLLSYSVE